MIRVVIVEDEKEQASRMKECLMRFGKENDTAFHIEYKDNAVNFLTNYKPQYDIVFMDIKMPYMDGMTAAEKLREIDSTILIVFVTNLVQYAVKGYKVNAIDFIVKPIDYFSFALTLKRCMEYVKKETSKDIVVSSASGMARIKTRDIVYVEVLRHRLIYHTAEGEYSCYGSLQVAEKEIGEPLNFAKCNSCYLVNLMYVKQIDGYSVMVDKYQLTISHPKKKEFIECFYRYKESKKQ